MATLTAYASSQDGTTPAGFNSQLTSPANAVGSGETTQATTAGVQNADVGGYYAFDLSGIPASSTINSVTLEARQWTTTNATRYTVGWRLDSVAGTQIANELTTTTHPTTAPTPAGTPGTGNSYSAWSAAPTLGQLQAAGFRARVRARRTVSQASTYTLDWVRITVDYTAPPTTVQGACAIAGAATATVDAISYLRVQGAVSSTGAATSSATARSVFVTGAQLNASSTVAATATKGYSLAASIAAAGTVAATGQLGSAESDRVQTFRATFPLPQNDLATGANRQTFRVRAGKQDPLGDDPRISVALHENGEFIAVVIAETAISGDTLLTGQWDAAVLSDITGAGVEAVVTATTTTAETTGNATIESVDWLYETLPLGYEPVSGAASVAGSATASATATTVGVGASAIACTSTVTATHVAAVRTACAIAGSATSASTGRIVAVGAVSASGHATATTTATVTRRGAAAITAYASLDTGGVVPLQGAADVAGASTASAAAVVVVRGVATVATGATLVITHRLVLTPGVVALAGNASLTAGYALTNIGQAEISGVGVLTVDGERVLVVLGLSPIQRVFRVPSSRVPALVPNSRVPALVDRPGRVVTAPAASRQFAVPSHTREVVS